MQQHCMQLCCTNPLFEADACPMISKLIGRAIKRISPNLQDDMKAYKQTKLWQKAQNAFVFDCYMLVCQHHAERHSERYYEA